MLSIHSDITFGDPENKVIGFSGSPRRNGNSDVLLNTIISGVKDMQVQSDFFNLTLLKFKGCIGCEKCRTTKICTGIKDDFSSIYPGIIGSKGLVLVSPTHNYNVTSWMKSFIDRLYCFYNFEDTMPRKWSSQFANQGRKAVVAAICEQASNEDMGFTIDAMKKPLEALGYEILGELSVLNVFDKGKVKSDTQAIKNAFKLGQKLGKSIKEA